MRGFDRLRLILAWTICTLYVIATILDAFLPNFEKPDDLSKLMLIVAGFLFTPTIIAAAVRRTNGKDNDD